MAQDEKLAALLRQGSEALARARLDILLNKRYVLATENYVRYCIGVAHASGFDLVNGDIALVHPEDLPRTVLLVEGRDPVYAIAHPEVLPGKMLFVRKHLKYRYLMAAQVRH